VIINKIPFGTSTPSLIESIIKANEKGKIKIHKIEDNTSDKVEVLIHLASGSDVQKTISALYAFTDCEISVSPKAWCYRRRKTALFLRVSDILRKTIDHTVSLLRKELEITLHDAQEGPGIQLVLNTSLSRSGSIAKLRSKKPGMVCLTASIKVWHPIRRNYFGRLPKRRFKSIDLNTH